MSGPNHVVGGVVFTGIYLSMWDKNIYGSPHFLFFTAFFSLLPDIDHTRSIIGKPFYPIALYLDRKFGHRTITHSLLCYIVVGITVGMIERIWLNDTTITKIYYWAYGSHLIFDMLTVQGVPLFYPFKKNPCVIPGNPSFRIRSYDLKSESIFFVIFILLAITCKDLFAHGFWNTYNRTWGSLKSLHTENLIYDKAITVDYEFRKDDKGFKGKGVLISSTEDEAIIFNKQFLKISKDDRIKTLTPIRTNKTISKREIQFTEISFDSLQKLISNKPILSLKLQSTLPISFIKENKPQSSTGVELEFVYNPVLKSQDIDSLDLTTAKELELTKQELNNQQEQLRIWSEEVDYYNQKKTEAFKKLSEIQAKLQSNDLSEREEAIRELPKAESEVKQLEERKIKPVDQTKSITIKMNFLRSKLRVKKEQSINGFIQYFIIN